MPKKTTTADGAQVGTPQTGAPGVTESVADIQKRAAAKPPQPSVPRESGDRRRRYPDRSKLPQNPKSPPVSRFPNQPD